MNIVQTIKSALFLSAALIGNQVDAENRNYYKIGTEALLCIKDNIALYQELEEPILVDIKSCPPNTHTSVLELLTNEVPDVSNLSDELDSFLALTTTELACLKELEIPLEHKIVRFYPEQCELEIDDD